MYKVDLIMAPLFTAVLSYVAYKLMRDIIEMNENRPNVTDAMVEQAYRYQVMSDFDSEFDSVDWEE